MESGVRRVLDIPELFLPGGTLAGIYGDFRLGQDVAAQSSVRSGAARSLPGLRAALGRRRPHHPARRAARCLAGPSRGHDLSGFSTFSAAFSHGKRAVAGHVSEIFPFRKTCATERGICSGGSASAARTFPRACFPGASSSAWPWPGRTVPPVGACLPTNLRPASTAATRSSSRRTCGSRPLGRLHAACRDPRTGGSTAEWTGATVWNGGVCSLVWKTI